MEIAFINDHYSALADAKISVFDRGLLFGDSVYEVLPVYNRKPHFVSRHIQRLNSNLHKTKIKIPDCNWNEIFLKLIESTDSDNLQLYIQITRGNQNLRKHDIPLDIQPTVIVFALHNSFPTYQDKVTGIKARLLDDYRWLRCDIKTTSLLANILLNDEAVTSGAETSILVRDGYITEGSASNVFIVTKDGIIKTPPLNDLCLPGITREITLELVQKLKWDVSETPVTVNELLEAREVWITSTTKEIFPVTQVNSKLIGNGHAGDYWHIIDNLYQNLIITS